MEEVADCKPDSAAAWLQAYLPKVKVIYAFQLLGGTEVNDGWTPLHSVHAKVWDLAGGLIQADEEGFTNEDGFTILWQFSYSASGSWKCAVLGKNGDWVGFEMELDNAEQREAFRRGELPNGVTLL